MLAERPPGAAAAAPSGSEETKWTSFGRLIQQASQAHDTEIDLLQREVQRLRVELATATAEVCSPGGGRADAGALPAPRGAQLEIPAAPLDDARASAFPGSSDQVVETSSALSTRSLPPSSPVIRHFNWYLNQGLRETFKGQDSLRRMADERGVLWRLAQHPMVEVVVAVVICFNGITMAAEAQYEGYDLALWTGHFSSQRPSDEMWPSAQAVFHALNWAFGVFFSLEIIFKIVALRAAFAKDLWNWTDLLLVILWWTGKLLQSLVNAQVLRVARLVRLVRLVRLIKAMNSSFDALHLLTTSLRSSMSILFWAFMMLIVLHLLLALLMNQVLRAVYFDAELGTALGGGGRGAEAWGRGQIDVFTYFGTFTRSFLTMFEITLANWPTACRVLVENVSEAFIIYSMLHKMVLGFAVLGIVNGIFIQETFKVASVDNSVMVRQTIRRQRIHCDKMSRLFEEADTNADGRIDRREWEEVCKDEWVRNWLLSQEIPVRDALTLFELLDDGDGQLTAQELIEGTARLKGAAASMDMTTKMSHVERCLKDINDELLANRSVAAERDNPQKYDIWPAGR